MFLVEGGCRFDAPNHQSDQTTTCECDEGGGEEPQRRERVLEDGVEWMAQRVGGGDEDYAGQVRSSLGE